MKLSWIGAFVVALLVAGLSGCASVFVRAWTWNGPPSTEQKVKALAFDVVTMPVQLPFWIAVGVGAGLDKLDRSIEDSSWQFKRNGLHRKFLKDSAKMQNVAPEFCSKGLPLGLVYADGAIPLSEKFLVAQVMQYFAYVRPMWPIGGDDELAALLHRKEWTEEGLRAVAPQLYLGRRHYPAPDYVTLAYLSNPKTPPDIVAAFAEHPSFKYRKADGYCRTMRDEISTNIIAHMEKPLPKGGEAIEEETDTPEHNFLVFLRHWTSEYFEQDATWRVGGGMWDLCAVGTPVKPCNLTIGDTRANIVELYGDKEFGGWDGKSKYLGGIGAVVLEFESVAMRDSFLRAVIPVCRICEPECWSQLVVSPMDGSGECYGICLERESKPEGSPSRIFIINLECPAPIRFWPPRQYGSEHVWFADGTIN